MLGFMLQCVYILADKHCVDHDPSSDVVNFDCTVLHARLYISVAYACMYALWDRVYASVLIECPVKRVLTSLPTWNCTDLPLRARTAYVHPDLPWQKRVKWHIDYFKSVEALHSNWYLFRNNRYACICQLLCFVMVGQNAHRCFWL